MDFSFCITSLCDDAAQSRLIEIINSIVSLNIPKYEILIIGENPNYTNTYIKYIYFDQKNKHNWITRKKNILAREAKYPILVMMHDYFVFDINWYNKYMLFGDNWDVCTNTQYLQDGRKHWLGWTAWDHPVYSRYTGLCCGDNTATQYLYISGAYYLVKKNIAINYPLNESLEWGQAEDVEWSLRVRTKCTLKCNPHTFVKHNKPHRDLSYYHFINNEC